MHRESICRILFFLQPWGHLDGSQQPLSESQFSAFDDRLRLISESGLFQMMYRNYKWPLLYYVLIVQITVSLKISVCFKLKQTLASIGTGQEYENALTLSLLLMAQVWMEQHYFQNIYQFSVKIRAAISQLLFKKVQCTTVSRLKDPGQVFNVISMDLADLDLTWLIAFTGAPIILTMATVLLWQFYIWKCLIGIATLIVFMIIQRYITSLMGPLKEQKNKYQDERTNLITEVINNLKLIKMQAIEHIYRDLIISKRVQQDSKLSQILNIDAICYYLNGNINVFVSLALMLSNQTSDEIFSTIWALQLIKVWVITYGQRTYKVIINLKILQSRLQEILNAEEVATQIGKTVSLKKIRKKYEPFKEEEESLESEDPNNKVSLHITDFIGLYNGKQVLTDISLSLQDPCFVVIKGATGSGKTCLFNAILQEMPDHQGQMQIKGQIAYVEEQPYIFPGTFQDNILFGLEFNKEHYEDVMYQSALDKDNIDANFDVGEGGCNISGGQRTRLSFARALYSDSDIYLFDDVLASVDDQVGIRMLETMASLKQKGKIVVLITHKTIKADRLFVMEQGKLVEVEEESISSFDSDRKVEEAQPERQLQKEQAQDQVVQLPLKVYQQYLQEGGTFKAIIIITLYLIDAYLAVQIINDFGEGHIDYDLIVVFSLVDICKFYMVFQFTLGVISSLHRKLVTSIIMAKISNLPIIGQIMTRFTTDLTNIELMVMLDLHWVIEGLIDNIFIIIIVSYHSLPILMLSLIFITSMLFIKSRFQGAMAKAIYSDDATRSKLYDYLQSSIKAITLIRVYNQRQRFLAKYLELTYNNMRAFFGFLRLNALLAFIIEFSLHLLIIAILVLLIQVSDDKEQIGFSILMLLQLGYLFSLNLRGQIYLDIDMQNAMRVMQAIQIPPEDYDGMELNLWPSLGQVEFRGVTLSYDQGKKALNNISFSLPAGKSLGIMGRTGSGKSSIINALFRLNPFEGQIFIDGLDISQASLSHLRESIGIIPQQGGLNSQTIKLLLDPRDQFKDKELLDLLQKLKLHVALVQTAKSLSTGQRQLLALGRVMLTKAKIIILDEATSNIDFETDAHIQNLLEQMHVTKIIIAHRSRVIESCDYVLKLQDGVVDSFKKIK